MDPVVIGLVAVALIPIALVVILVRRAGQARRAHHADLVAFARAHGLDGSVGDDLSLRGVFDGMPCYASVDRVGQGKERLWILRVRLLRSESTAYREAPPAASTAILLGRNETVPVDRVSGLDEMATGDPAFDDAYRGFVAPGTTPPWHHPTLHASLLSLAGFLARAERGPHECSIAFREYYLRGALIRRGMVIASAFASTESARRHEAELATPFFPSTPVEDSRVGWATARMLTVFILGFVAAFPLTFTPPVHALVESVACDEGEVLGTVGVSNGRGVNYVCTGKRGRHDAGGWLFFVGVDAGFVASLLFFSILELTVRTRRRVTRR